AEQLEDLVVHRLSGRDHLAETEQRLDQRSRGRVDLLREVGQRRAASEPDGLAVAARQPHTADRRCLHRIVFRALLPLRLAAATRGTTATTERTCGTAAATSTTATTGTTAEATVCTGTCG